MRLIVCKRLLVWSNIRFQICKLARSYLTQKQRDHTWSARGWFGFLCFCSSLFRFQFWHRCGHRCGLGSTKCGYDRERQDRQLSLSNVVFSETKLYKKCFCWFSCLWARSRMNMLDGASVDETCSRLKFKGQVWATPDESTHTWSAAICLN